MKRYASLAAVLLVLAVAGCSSGGSPSPTTTYDAYIAGTVGNPDPSAPGYWKDGTFNKLGAVAGSFDAYVSISGTDVYACGKDQSGAPVYWKNGTPTPLTLPGSDTFSFFEGIGAIGTTVYVLGYDNNGNEPVLWINGSPHILTFGSGTGGNVNSLLVAGSNLYLTGGVNGSPGFPAYWDAAGTLHQLPEGSGSGGWTPGINSTPSAAVVSGNDIYIVGTTYISGKGTPIVWKNGSILWTGAMSTTNYAAQAIAVSGSDVYVTGEVDNNGTGSNPPVYWKNGGNAIPLPTTGLSSSQVTAQYIAVAGGNIYIEGKPVYYQVADPLTPILWVNGGTPINMTYPSGTALAIAGMAAAGSDVWIEGTSGTSAGAGSGQLDFNQSTYPVVWKNGTIVTLSSGGEQNGGTGNIFVLSETK